MSVKVTIELTDESARWLRSMASLGRMCDEIARVLTSVEECENVDDELAQDCQYAREAILEAKPTLMNIEYCRQQLIDAGVKRLWKSGTENLEKSTYTRQDADARQQDPLYGKD